MSGRRIAGWTYVAAALACLAGYHCIGRGNRPWDTLLWMYDPPVRFEILPLVLLSLFLAVTRACSVARGSLEVVAAVAWCATVSAFGAWRYSFNTVDRVGGSTIDALAFLMALTALSMLAVGFSGVVSSRQRGWWLAAGQILQALALVALAYSLMRMAVLSFLSTRVLRGGGIEGFSYELRLRERLFIAAMLLLSATGLVVAIDRLLRFFARDRAVEQGDEPVEARS